MEVKLKKNGIDMTEGNLFKKIIFFSVPLILSGLLQLLYNASDLIVVGNFGGDNSLGAIGNTGSLINLIVNVFLGLSVGANVSLANAIGSKNMDRAHRVVQSAILLSILGGISVGFFGFFLSRTFLEWMKTPEDVIDLSAIYIRIYFIGMPANLLYNFGAALLRAKGDTKRPLIFLSISGLVNVGLNLFFVIAFSMDVVGVALATIIAQYLSALLVVYCLVKEKDYAHFNPRDLHLYKEETKQIIRIGLPAGIQGSVFSISNVLIQSSVNSFGSTVMNGNSAAQNIEGFTYTAMNSIYHAALSFTGQNYGAKKIRNIGKIYLYCLLIVTVIGIVMGGGSYLFGRQLLSLYTDTEEEIRIGLIRMMYLALPYFLCGIMDVTCGMLRGLGRAITPMIVSLVGVCGFRILWIFTVFKAYPDLNWLYISYPISWILTFLVHLFVFLIVYRKNLTNSEIII